MIANFCEGGIECVATFNKGLLHAEDDSIGRRHADCGAPRTGAATYRLPHVVLGSRQSIVTSSRGNRV